MSEAVVNLITRDAVELHFQGLTYGPVAHTEALAVLLFWLAPGEIRGIGRNRRFEDAMGEMLDAARAVWAQLDDAEALRDPHEDFSSVAPPGFDQWAAAAMDSLPRQKVDDFQRRFGPRTATTDGRPRLLH